MDTHDSVGTFTIILIICIFAASGVFTNKAFFCQDPDTGKFYPVNSTWNSSSFCGRYTCKLRKKSNNSPPQPLTVLNNHDTKDELSSTSTEGTHHKNCSQPVGVIVEDKVTSDIQKILHKPKEDTYINTEKFKKGEEVKNVELGAKTLDGDRYLTEEEITALSVLLKTMKKSDLEAILEVYNLAQDIYRDVDKIPDEKFIASNTQDHKDIPKNKNPKVNEIPDDIRNKKIISYWYEPLTPVNSKLKAAEAIHTSQEQNYVKLPQVKPNAEANIVPKPFYEGLNLLDEIKRKNKFELLPKMGIRFKPYIEAPLATTDFRKLPYYHPMTNFQKQASYVHPTNSYSQSNSAPIPFSQITDYTQQALYAQPAISPEVYRLQQYPQSQMYPHHHKPEFVQQKLDKSAIPIHLQNQNVASSEYRGHHGKCCKNHQQELLYRLIPWTKTIEDRKKSINNMNYDDRKLSYQPDKIYDARSPIPYSESKINNNIDLSMVNAHDYNVSSLQPYNLENTWRLLGLSDKIRRHNHPAYFGAPFLAHAPNKLAANSEESRDVDDEEQEQAQNIKNDISQLPDWQTEPLPINVLNEVKANMAESKFLPYPFRKKVRVERVGKLLPIDEVGRLKRDVASKNLQEKKETIVPEEYEVYIEKSTCETDTKPGFFRMGNVSEPYPACCPQRIPS